MKPEKRRPVRRFFVLHLGFERASAETPTGALLTSSQSKSDPLQQQALTCIILANIQNTTHEKRTLFHIFLNFARITHATSAITDREFHEDFR